MELKNQGITAGSIDVSKVDDILDGKYSIVCGSAESYGGGGLLYKKDGDARREILIERLKGTNLGVA